MQARAGDITDAAARVGGAVTTAAAACGGPLTSAALAAFEQELARRAADCAEGLHAAGLDPRAEIDYVETFTEIVETNDAAPGIPLTPERVAPFVDVLRGITSASGDERGRAARMVPDLLPDLRSEEQWGFTGALARAAAVEDDSAVRVVHLAVLVESHRAGAIRANDSRVLVTAFSDATLATTERRAVDELQGG